MIENLRAIKPVSYTDLVTLFLIFNAYYFLLKQFVYSTLSKRWLSRGMDVMFLRPTPRKANSDLNFASSILRAERVKSESNPNDPQALTNLFLYLATVTVPIFYDFTSVVGASQIWMILFLETFVYLTGLCLISDLLYRKVPSGACWLNLGLSTLFIALYSFASHNQIPIAESLLATGILGILGSVFALFTRGTLGSGDVRFMLTLAPLAALFGWTTVLLGIAFGSIVQVLLRPLLRKRNYHGKGLPFLPALIIGTIISILLFHSGNHACSDLAGLIACR